MSETDHLLAITETKDESSSPPPKKLSTFFGVFVPCVLSMFSVILFLRMGYIVGQAGALVAAAMFALAYIIVGLTVLSIAAISTNGAIRGGGAYFMISRALGPEFGGSIGVIFYFANVFSTGVYVLGVVEALVGSFGVKSGDYARTLPDGRGWDYLLGTAILIFCLLVCLVGPQMFAKTTFVIFLVVMVVALAIAINFFVKTDSRPISVGNVTYYYTGFSGNTFVDNLMPNFTVDYTTGKQADFAVVFGVLFNGCTGIMAGANLSGDLAKPSRSIPLGTIVACFFTFIIYQIFSIFLAVTCSRSLLVNDYNVMQSISFWGPLVTTGVLTVTLSAALSTFIGATRILKAVADDNIFGIVLRPFKLATRSGNPYMAIFITWILVQAIISVGQLNVVAPFATGFFLLSYSATNLACLALELASAPNFRPTFRYYHWVTSLLGVISTFAMMFVVNQIYAAVAVVVMLLLFVFIHFYSGDQSWGDISQALIFHQVRKYLLLLDPRREHVKFWRPQVLFLVNNPRSVNAASLVHFVNDMKKGGLYVIGHVIVGQLDSPGAAEQRRRYAESLQDHVSVAMPKIKAFVEVTFAESVRLGAQSLIMTSGLGGMKPRMIVMGFYDASVPREGKIETSLPRRQQRSGRSVTPLSDIFPPLRQDDERTISVTEYVSIIRDCLFLLDKDVVLARNFSAFDRSTLSRRAVGNIDIWPLDPRYVDADIDYGDATCDFMLQIGCVLHMVPLWKRTTRIRVFAVGVDEAMAADNEAKLKGRLVDVRIPATVIPVVVDGNANSLSYVKDGSQVDQMESILAVNKMMRDFSGGSLTKVLFACLWEPPTDPDDDAAYLNYLEAFTADLPPTLLLRGLSTVTMRDQ